MKLPHPAHESTGFVFMQTPHTQQVCWHAKCAVTAPFGRMNDMSLKTIVHARIHDGMEGYTTSSFQLRFKDTEASEW